MKVTLESTTKIVVLETVGRGKMSARVWEGKTEDGIPVHAFITRIAVEEGRPDADYRQFEKDLTVCVEPSALVESIPMRMVIG